MNSVSTGYAFIKSDVTQTDAKRATPEKMSAGEFQDFLGAMKKHLDASRKQQAASTAGLDTAQPAREEETDKPSEAEKKVAEGRSDAVKAFLEYIAKTPEQRYFEAFLNSKGMTEEGFQALPAAEKQAVVKEFEDYVKQHVGDASAERLARAAGGGLF